MAQWLKQEFSDIDHHADNDYCYKNCNYEELVKWLNTECYLPHHHIKASIN